MTTNIVAMRARNKKSVDRVSYKKGMVIVMKKKEKMCRKRRKSCSNTQRTYINHLRRQK